MTYNRYANIDPAILADVHPDLLAGDLDDACWDDYEAVGLKPGAGGAMVPNCVPVKSAAWKVDAASPDDDKQYKTILRKLATAKKLLAKVSEQRVTSYRAWIGKQQKAAEAAGREPADADSLNQMQIAKDVVLGWLKDTATLSLRPGTRVWPEVKQAVKDLPHTTAREMDEVAGAFSVIDNAAYFVWQKTEWAEKVVGYCEKWVEFYKANDRTPSFSEQDKWLKSAAWKVEAKRTTHLEDEDKAGYTLCGERVYMDTLVQSVKNTTCHYCKQAWEDK